MPLKAKKEVVKLKGRLKEVTTITDEKGKFLHKLIDPIVTEFHLKDFFQVLIGASILAIPVGFTEETWHLGESLPILNVLGFAVLSVLFISAFVFYNYERKHFKIALHLIDFAKRVLITYFLSFIVVAILLILIQKAPWLTDSAVAFKRTVLVTFPSSMSAAIADTIK